MTTAPPTDDLSRAGRRLQLTRAAQWFAGGQGDPYALVLRALAADPASWEEEIRARGPLFRSALPDTWVTAHRAVADEVTTRAEFCGLLPDGTRPGHRDLPLTGGALTLDRAAWTRLRRTAPPGGTDEDALGRAAEETARTLLAGTGDTFDLADDYARPLTATVLAGALELTDHQEGFRSALDGTRHALDEPMCPQLLDTARTGVAAEAGLTALLGEALPDPAPDRVLAARALAVSAYDITAGLVCNAVRLLWDHPAQWAALTDEPGLAGAAVAETLRWAPPVRLERRVAVEDVTVAGTRLPAGAAVTVLVAAVHRDPAAGPGACAPDLHRARAGTGRPPFTLPGDLYFGLSGPLIRTVARAALRVLAEDAPGLRPAGAPVRRRRSPVLHGHARFPVAQRVHPEGNRPTCAS